MGRKDSREEIIRTGIDLVSRRGFNTTGIDSVLKSAHVPKGSFYHYFKSKEEFGISVLDSFAERFGHRLDTFIGDAEVAPLHRLRNFLENAKARVVQNDFQKGCPLGNLGQETGELGERFRCRLETVFQRWETRFSECLREARERGDISHDIDPDILACFIVSGWEGAILRAKVMKSAQPMDAFIEVLFTTILG
jgi:TetR/AcrR family transcriptional repressor of nem operon